MPPRFTRHSFQHYIFEATTQIQWDLWMFFFLHSLWWTPPISSRYLPPVFSSCLFSLLSHCIKLLYWSSLTRGETPTTHSSQGTSLHFLWSCLVLCWTTRGSTLCFYPRLTASLVLQGPPLHDEPRGNEVTFQDGWYHRLCLSANNNTWA